MRLSNFRSTNDVGSVSIDRENCLHVHILTRVRLLAGLEPIVLIVLADFKTSFEFWLSLSPQG